MKKIISILLITLFISSPCLSDQTEIKITSIIENNADEVEIYMAPGEPCCVAALEEIKKICEENKASVSIKPVGIGCKNRYDAAKWMCKKLFSHQTKETIGFAEKAVLKNEAELKKMSPEKYPIIIFKKKSNKTSQKFEGWDSINHKNLILSMKDETTPFFNQK